MTDSLVITQMPQIGWIDALRTYNLGGSSWCIPRKGTPEYEKVMVIRRGGAEDVKPQPRRRTVKARVPEEKAEPEPEAKVEIPAAKVEHTTFLKLPQVKDHIKEQLIRLDKKLATMEKKAEFRKEHEELRLGLYHKNVGEARKLHRRLDVSAERIVELEEMMIYLKKYYKKKFGQDF